MTKQNSIPKSISECKEEVKKKVLDYLEEKKKEVEELFNKHGVLVRNTIYKLMNLIQPETPVPVKVEYWPVSQLGKIEVIIDGILNDLKNENREQKINEWYKETLERLRIKMVEYIKTRVENEDTKTNIKDGYIFDLLGAYYYNDKHIELYSHAIALTAEFLNVSLECLTCVVLAHETVHAAIQVGMYCRPWINEIKSWKYCYEACDSTFHEAIAQYFTHKTCLKLNKGNLFNMKDAFENLLKTQPQIYKNFEQIEKVAKDVDEYMVHDVLGIIRQHVHEQKISLAAMNTELQNFAKRIDWFVEECLNNPEIINPETSKSWYDARMLETYSVYRAILNKAAQLHQQMKKMHIRKSK